MRGPEFPLWTNHSAWLLFSLWEKCLQNCLSVKVKTNSLWLHQQPALPGDSWLPAGWWSFRLLMRLTPGLRDCKQIRLFVCHLPQLTVAIFEHFNSILSSVVWNEERRADILLVNDFMIQNVSMVLTPCIIIYKEDEYQQIFASKLFLPGILSSFLSFNLVISPKYEQHCAVCVSQINKSDQIPFPFCSQLIELSILSDLDHLPQVSTQYS